MLFLCTRLDFFFFDQTIVETVTLKLQLDLDMSYDSHTKAKFLCKNEAFFAIAKVFSNTMETRDHDRLRFYTISIAAYVL